MNGIMPATTSLLRHGRTTPQKWPSAERICPLKLTDALRHIKVLEADIAHLRAVLTDRENAITRMNEIAARLTRFETELFSMLKEFRRTSAALMRLSAAEQRVFDCYMMDRNQANKEIAAKLGIGLSTVKFHMAAIRMKAGVRSRAEL